MAVAYQHVSETPLAPTEVNDAAPGALNPIVLRALAKDPSQRFPDAASFRKASPPPSPDASPRSASSPT
ncbi:hypothetical protein [Microbacterium sp. NIBRBAC000506063]|uniref:hypothetical protein n=1 Tax=Microbacterium sp. NIBRBAC000506063 TaxID=2734618 RepID=UPI002948BD59|nr:hypothetical protein [Microbacterium sp. NIBRBAC000506063]